MPLCGFEFVLLCGPSLQTLYGIFAPSLCLEAYVQSVNGTGTEGDSGVWELVGAVICFAGAAFSLAIGFVLTTRALLNATVHPRLHGVGLTLLIVGIPILILGGHFMDLRERKVDHGNRREAVISR